MKKYFTISEAAKICKCSIWTLHRRIKDGDLVAFHAGGGRKNLIYNNELFDFIKKNKIFLEPNELKNFEEEGQTDGQQG